MGYIGIEVPFRAVPQFDFRIADLAFVSQKRWDAIDPEGNRHGAPELVVEVKSELNSWAELRERAITVFAPDDGAAVYTEADLMPLALFGTANLPVQQVFD